VSRRVAFLWDGRTVEATLETKGASAVLTREGKRLEAEVHREERRIELTTARGRATLEVVSGARDIWVSFEGRAYHLERPHRERPAAAAESGTDEIRAPMTGRVAKVAAAAGATAREGDLLLVIEAMKMEFRLTAPEDGIVAEVRCAEGDPVELGQLLVRLTPAAAPESEAGATALNPKEPR
jgi:biotin carboxyl carrier protein